MALSTVSTTDIQTFLNQISNPEPLALNPQGTGRLTTMYQRLDHIYVPARNSSGTVQRFGWVDPLFVDGTVPSTDYSQGVTMTNIFGCIVGEWNRSLGVQRFYTLDSTAAGGKLVERDPITLQIINADPWPVFRNESTTKISSEDGYYINLSGDYVIFEEQGKIYTPHANVRFSGTPYTEVFAEIDLALGTAIPIAAIPGKALASPSVYQEPQLFNDTVDWMRIQFIADDDSTHINPKGFLVLSEQDGQAGAGVSASERAYVRFVDWNPNGVSGSPNRVHQRITTTTRIEFDETIVGTAYNNAGLVYHPLSRRLYWISNNGFNPAVAGTNIIYRFGTTPGLAELTSPAPETTPRTAGTTAFFVEAIGSLGEKIPGVGVQFTLTGASTLLELLDTSAGVGGAAAAVAKIPIDQDDGLKVYEDDGAGNLTELTGFGTHYSTNFSTGVHTGVSPHWKAGVDYYTSYNHVLDPSAAPLGDLLTPIVSTDNNGRGRTRVRYADNDDLLDRRDKLSAETI